MTKPNVHTQEWSMIKYLPNWWAYGETENKPYQPNHWINIQGDAIHYSSFQEVSHTPYFDELLRDTIEETDIIIDKMMKG